VKAHYDDPLWGTFGSNIIIVPKHGTFNFGYQFGFYLTIIIFKIIINFIIYIEESMSIFIIYIDIIGTKFCFDYINFKVSLVIKIINFNGMKKNSHLTMLVIFYVNVITCRNFNLPHIY
jgi:hypothetical protein